MKITTVCAFFATFAAALKVNIPDSVQKLESPTGKKFALIPPSDGTTRAESIEKCLVLGGRLADIKLGEDFDYLSSTLKGTAWINSFEGKDFDGACFAIFEGGAIAVPVGNCESIQGVLCDL